MQRKCKMALSNLHKKYEEIIDASEEIANFKEISVLNTVVVQSIEERRYGNFTRPRIESNPEKNVLHSLWIFGIIM
ncbi:MAG: hypothetical protein IPJ39_14625 [Saprospiraceae bacterium]|nr:hypothetical protein [Saprospiraceae bacterium]